MSQRYGDHAIMARLSSMRDGMTIQWPSYDDALRSKVAELQAQLGAAHDVAAALRARVYELDPYAEERDMAHRRYLERQEQFAAMRRAFPGYVARNWWDR